ncbi:unnamed protein product [Urochloa decumbens]|uniref:WIYLD domain-containing protein n=1 Tax=Urochloa decumbens TaxID=240449 RepID=A0ABC9EYM9_9POAL
MPARRGRPRKGERRIDAAIDHFAAMGYAERDVRDAVASLLEVYGGPSAWPLLEEGSYHAVQDKLFEREEEEKQKQPLLLEGQQVEEDRPQHQEPVVDKAPPENESAHEEVEDPMFIKPVPLEVIAQVTAAIGTGRTRRPCYGWLSESEDEEELTSQPHVPGSGGWLLKRK